MTKGIITKIENSYIIRVPKRYIDDNNLKLGDVVEVEDPLVKQQKALKALIDYGRKSGPLIGVSDPVAWQRKQRSWDDPWRRRKT